MKKSILSFLVICLLFFSCNNSSKKTTTENKTTETNPPVIPVIHYTYVNSYPHDTTSFTEGLLVHNGKLYESTGATQERPETRSLFGVVDLNTGKIDVKAELNRDKYFGEGITFLNGKVFQLTYQTKVGFIYDEKTFKKLGEFPIPSKEGWGMTTDGKNLIMSDGTDVLTYLDPNTLKVIKMVKVTENGFVRDFINELEYINGYIYANVWTTNTIVKIDPANGNVVGRMDLNTLAQEAESTYRGSLEMNGIAYDAATDKIYVTGKMWPKIYEIKFEH